MYISHKSNILLNIADTEWDCRRQSKGMSKPEYWAWIATITSGDPPVVTYPSEDFTIIEIQDENVSERLSQLDSYVSSTIKGTTYNIKVYSAKRNAEEIKDIDGKSFSPKQYVSSHFVGDDTAKDERVLADKWANIRNFRNQDLASSDWTILDDSPLASSKKLEWQVYRQKLRDLPKDNDDPDDVTWPNKP